MGEEVTIVQENASCTSGSQVSRFSIRELIPRHFRIIDMLEANHSITVIADTLGMTKRTISTIARSPLVQAELARRRKEDKTSDVLGMDREAMVGKARSILEQATEPAARKIEQLMQNAPDASIQLRAAQDILDRVFGKSGQGTQIGTVINVSAEHVQLLNQAIKESNNEYNPMQQPNHAPARATEGGQVDAH